jgi:GH24 family phage-related lysozyme (muramidase)
MGNTINVMDRIRATGGDSLPNVDRIQNFLPKDKQMIMNKEDESKAESSANTASKYPEQRLTPGENYMTLMNRELSNIQAYTSWVSQLYDMIKQHEGVKTQVYTDPKGFPTIGVGFNLTRSDAASRLQALGVSLDEVMQGKSLTMEQVESLLRDDVEQTIHGVRQLIPTFDSLSSGRKIAIVDMAYNMGIHALSEFTTFLRYFIGGDYVAAAEDLKHTRYYAEVPNRAKQNIRLILHG